MEFNMELVGYLGGFLLAICAIPEAYRSWVNKRSDIGYGMLLTWFFGEILTLIYVLPKGDMPLILNYSLNILFICVIIKYKMFPEEE